METITKPKKDVQNFIKKELASILIRINPKMDKRDFKKSIKKARKILYKGSKRTKNTNNPIEVISNHGQS